MPRQRSHDGRVAILVQQLAARDAIGNDTVCLTHALGGLGFRVRVFASAHTSHPEGAEQSSRAGAAGAGDEHAESIEVGSLLAARAFLAHGNPLVIYQLATRWDDGMAIFAGCRGVRIVRDHNVTPARFLAPLDEELGMTQRLATRDRERLARDRGVALFLAASATNRAELIALGAPAERVDVVPPLHPFDELDRVTPAGRDGAGGDSSNGAVRNPVAIFVGRIAPHKGHLRSMRVAASYRQLFGETLRLRFVGSTDRHTHAWRDVLDREAGRLDLEGTIEFLSGLDLARLKSAYLTADLMLCCSEHEGVCVPLIEASQLGVPVVASYIPAVAETLGPGALVCRDASDDALATAVHHVLTDATLRTRLVAAQRAHVQARFAPDAIARALADALEPGRLEARIAAAGSNGADSSELDRGAESGVGAEVHVVESENAGARATTASMATGAIAPIATTAAATTTSATEPGSAAMGAPTRARIGILVPSILPADATGKDAFGMHAALAARGHDARIYAGTVAEDVDTEGARIDELDAARSLVDDPSAILIYHHATAWEAGQRVLADARAAIVVRDHNVTPPEWLAAVSPEGAAASERGRKQRAALARDSRIALFLADSKSNADELRALGAPSDRIAVVPPLGRVEDLLRLVPEEMSLRRWSRRPADVLFVGRLAPSKGQQRILAVAARHRELFGETLRVRLAGPADPALRMYWHALERDRRRLELGDSVEYVGVLSDAELKSAYLTTRIFLCCSEHEGYCVPLVEAAALGVPVVAVHQAAVAETLGPRALVLHSPSDDEIAATVHRVIHDATLRERLIDAQRRHYQASHAPDLVRSALVAALERLIERPDASRRRA